MNEIIRLCGKEGTIKPVHVEARPGEVQRLVANASKAQELLGWEPKYKLEDGLREFIDWYKNYKSEEWVKPRMDKMAEIYEEIIAKRRTDWQGDKVRNV